MQAPLALAGARPCLAADTTVASAAPETGSADPHVLNPDQYIGQAKAGYKAAQQVPEICAKLFCYCGCDLTDCHGTLLDCFTSDHGVDCHICQEEAIIALQMHKKGKSLAKIQRTIDKRYGKEYPFEEESPALTKYKANRLWGSKKKAQAQAKSEEQAKAKPEKQAKPSSDAGKPKLKEGAKMPECCGHEKKPEAKQAGR